MEKKKENFRNRILFIIFFRDFTCFAASFHPEKQSLEYNPIFLLFPIFNGDICRRGYRKALQSRDFTRGSYFDDHGDNVEKRLLTVETAGKGKRRRTGGS